MRARRVTACRTITTPRSTRGPLPHQPAAPVTGPVFGPHPGAEHTHEQVVFVLRRRDRPAGHRRASTPPPSGPALGGTRFYPYADEAEAALADALKLSRGMSYKNALAGLDHGGGKAVIIGDPAETRPRSCCWPTAGSWRASAAATSRPATSAPTSPTWTSSRASYPLDHRPLARERRRGRLLGAHRVRRLPGHAGRRRAPVGRRRACRPHGRHRRASARSATTWSGTCVEDGADCGRHRCATSGPGGGAVGGTPRSRWSPTPTRWSAPTSTSTSPCALGGALTDEVVAVLRARLVCGAANNQLAHPGVEKELADRGILYAPDYW